jgi:hypothetical protein
MCMCMYMCMCVFVCVRARDVDASVTQAAPSMTKSVPNPVRAPVFRQQQQSSSSSSSSSSSMTTTLIKRSFSWLNLSPLPHPHLPPLGPCTCILLLQAPSINVFVWCAAVPTAFVVARDCLFVCHFKQRDREYSKPGYRHRHSAFTERRQLQPLQRRELWGWLCMLRIPFHAQIARC